MSVPYSPNAGLWWRFSSYELSRGYLRPAPDAHIEKYDPWLSFTENRDSTQYEGQPYASLLKIIDELEYREDDNQKPTDTSVAEILEWCSKHGLLGLLPHRIETVALAARWAHIDNDPVLIPAQRTICRTPLGFRAEIREIQVQSRDSSAKEGDLVDPKVLPVECPEAGTILRHAGGSGLSLEPLTETWARYFPDVPEDEAETYPYPTIVKEDFWWMYGEPLQEFLVAARMLRDAVVCLSDYKQDRHSNDEEVWDGVEALNGLVAGVRRAMIPTEPEGLIIRSISPSLLASFAAMAQADLDENRRVLRCELCGGLFVTSAYQARFCSNKCRYTLQKRRQRAKQKANMEEKNHA